MLLNNLCLFLLFPENGYLYSLLCLNCHRLLYARCLRHHSHQKEQVDVELALKHGRELVELVEKIPSQSAHSKSKLSNLRSTPPILHYNHCGNLPEERRFGLSISSDTDHDDERKAVEDVISAVLDNAD